MEAFNIIQSRTTSPVNHHLPNAGGRGLLLVYFVICVLLPTGSIYGFNVKIAIFGLTLLVIVARPLEFGVGRSIWLGCLGFASVLAAWLVIAQIDGRASLGLSVSQYKDIIITAATAFLTVLYSCDRARRDRFIATIVNALAVLALLKLTIFAYCYVTGTPTIDVIEAISKAFGTKLITLEEDDVTARIQFVSDTIAPIALFIMLVCPARIGYGSARATLIFGLLLFSIVVSFSRYLWAFAALAVILGMLLSRFDRTKLLYIALAAAVFVYFSNELTLIYELRTSERYVTASDSERDDQRQALVEFFVSAPLVGHGLGSYTSRVIRDDKLKYSYELQLLALLGQLGLLGCFCLIVVGGAYFRRSLRGSVSCPAAAGVLTLTACWLAAGMFNPLLTSSSAGVGFGLLRALAWLVDERRPGNWLAISTETA